MVRIFQQSLIAFLIGFCLSAILVFLLLKAQFEIYQREYQKQIKQYEKTIETQLQNIKMCEIRCENEKELFYPTPDLPKMVCGCESEVWIETEIRSIEQADCVGCITHDRLAHLLEAMNCRRKCMD